MMIQNRKQELRIELKKRRQSFAQSAEHLKASIAISDLLDIALPKDVKTVATYAALPDEASAHNLKDLRPHLTWAYPKVVGSELEFYQVTDSGQLEKGTFDILEPTSDCVKISINDCESVIVPGVGFDRRGHRLGQGRGFYDRALAGYQGQKIGVCFETQILNKDLPIEDHDLPMDVIVNEKYIFSPVVGKVKGI